MYLYILRPAVWHGADGGFSLTPCAAFLLGDITHTAKNKKEVKFLTAGRVVLGSKSHDVMGEMTHGCYGGVFKALFGGVL